MIIPVRYLNHKFYLEVIPGDYVSIGDDPEANEVVSFVPWYELSERQQSFFMKIADIQDLSGCGAFLELFGKVEV